jgi:hypothetical protein
MNWQAVLETKKAASLTHSGSPLSHAAYRPVPDQDLPAAVPAASPANGHDFSRLPVSAIGNTESLSACPMSPRRCPYGGACHTCHQTHVSAVVERTIKPPRINCLDLTNVVVGASPGKSEDTGDTLSSGQDSKTLTEMKDDSGSGNHHPFTAVFLMTSSTGKSCAVPVGMHGSAKLAKFRIIDAAGQAVRNPHLVEEQLTKLDGPDELFNLLRPNSYRASEGYFDDCYKLFSSKQLPKVSLTVKQNHKIGDEIISENHVTYSPSNILIRVCPRQERGFGTRCKLY